MRKLYAAIIVTLFVMVMGVGSSYYRDLSTQQAANIALRAPGYGVAMGDISGVTSVHKFGDNPDIDTTSDPEDVWGHDSLYVWPSVGVTHYISSSSAADTMIIVVTGARIEIQGLDSLWASQIDTISMAGQTKTAIDGKWRRIFRARNIGNVALVGTAYIYEDCGVASGVPNISAKVTAVIRPNHQQTMMAVYSVPLGKTAVITRWTSASVKSIATSADLLLKVRSFGGVFRTQDRMVVSKDSGTKSVVYPVPLVYAAKTDIIVRCETVAANGTAVVSSFDIILVDD